MQDAERMGAYACDITYTTAKEVTADLLRDQLRLGPLAHSGRRLVHRLAHPERYPSAVLRGLHAAIVDEADHALIDEAVTPLIISRPQENLPLVSATRAAAAVANTLVRGEDYTVDERAHRIHLRPQAFAKAATFAEHELGIWSSAARRAELLTQSLVARELYHAGKQYVIHEDKVVIIDESTGRLMPQRTWRQGLHQAIEVKEGLTPTPPAETLARLSFQRFFRLYHNLAGITGTGAEAAAECWSVYRLPFVRIPTHRPSQRLHGPDRFFPTSAEKWQAVVLEASRLRASGRPVLIGTRSVAASEHLARLFDHDQIPYHLLNAVRDQEEATIVAAAGEPGRITIATNMAGRGTDIALAPGVAGAGGLHVLATERHSSSRVDRQLFGRAGRQGDPGSAQAFVAFDDELLRRWTPSWALEPAAALLRAGSVKPAALLVSRAQKTADRAARLQRAEVQRSDAWLEEGLGFARSSHS
jgi:preprotein translocase subunit SecA